MMKFAFDGIISFSNAPLRLALRAGFVLSALAIAAGVVAIILTGPHIAIDVRDCWPRTSPRRRRSGL